MSLSGGNATKVDSSSCRSCTAHCSCCRGEGGSNDRKYAVRRTSRSYSGASSTTASSRSSSISTTKASVLRAGFAAAVGGGLGNGPCKDAGGKGIASISDSYVSGHQQAESIRPSAFVSGPGRTYRARSAHSIAGDAGANVPTSTVFVSDVAS
ncbi:hypothetical protein CF319_g6404 [Tilletia indica]|uniref:Uncharacterized protein n=1 Tax=Tilletia indica TaxID=43049 RepID=A0A177TEA0_9BASI|nr:hypothetical protein CF319_g6404 [Tilletia indica]KAE8241350.1 hypothetical protein A4X13_0g7451 [Tilletia indica]